MKVDSIQSRKDLPHHPAELLAFSWELLLAYRNLSEKYQRLLKGQYGRSSEKIADQKQLDAIQMEMDELLAQVTQTQNQDDPKEQEYIEVQPFKRRRKHPGRNKVPQELITDTVIDVPKEEMICPCCGKETEIIDRKEHIVVERKPATYSATRYIRPVRACPRCKNGVVVAEPVVTPIAKGMAGPFLLTFVILSKYVYHLPLYRIQHQIYHESGIWITRATLSNWVGGISASLNRIYRLLLQAYKSSRKKHADETPFKVRTSAHTV
jgi:transposase